MKQQPKPMEENNQKKNDDMPPFGISQIIFKKLWKQRLKNELDRDVKQDF